MRISEVKMSYILKLTLFPGISALSQTTDNVQHSAPIMNQTLSRANNRTLMHHVVVFANKIKIKFRHSQLFFKNVYTRQHVSDRIGPSCCVE
jgi:hypothetical protein